jgi:hypothetical protein
LASLLTKLLELRRSETIAQNFGLSRAGSKNLRICRKAWATELIQPVIGALDGIAPGRGGRGEDYGETAPKPGATEGHLGDKADVLYIEAPSTRVLYSESVEACFI